MSLSQIHLKKGFLTRPFLDIVAHLSRLEAISSTDYLPRAFCSQSMKDGVIYLFIVASVLSFFKGLDKQSQSLHY